MTRWYIEYAPVRLKLLLAFGTMTGLTAVAALGPLLLGGAALYVGLAATLLAALAGLRFRHMIADPYVATVVRMEALAAGDLTSPIERTAYTDCVGRMTRAMFTFRDTAASQIAINQEAETNARIVGTMADNFAALAAGDLTTAITTDFPTRYAGLKTTFNAAVNHLCVLVHGIVSNADGIRVGTQEIAQASDDLARRTAGNAASLEETSAALRQIDERIKSSATASVDTVTRANQAIATVHGGRATAGEAVAAMGRVSGSAKGIDSVIEGLDKIAFQTRVLAMNAAVEAGRAGDAGRGFAVVADLVSALAMRAEEEAKRARDQLTVTQAEVVTAVAAVERVDAALGNIAGDVDAVHKLLGSIATANQAQSLAITEINAAVATMDRSTQQNAAMVEQTTAATRALSDEVEAMAEHAREFIFERRHADLPVERDRRERAATVAPGVARPQPTEPRTRSRALPSRPASPSSFASSRSH